MNNQILVVDDDPIIRLIHTKVLDTFGLKQPILAFPHGQQALCHIQNCDLSKNFLVLLDINMPVMNAWEFLLECERISCTDRICTVIVSSSINPLDQKKAFKRPVVKGFIEKPFNLKTVDKLKEIEGISKFLIEST